MIAKERLVFDTANASEGDVVASYLKGADGTLLTHTTVSGKEALDVNVANTVTVTATDLDIRDLSHTQDSVKIGDGTDFLAVNNDGSINAVVSATNLDIRDLTAASDSVQAWAHDGAGTAITSTTAGAKQALDVNITNAIMVDLNGVYDAGTNPTPDTVGAILHQRAASPAASDQTFRSTGGAASSDAVTAANVHAADVNSFLMGYNGTTWDRIKSVSGAMRMDITSQSLSQVVVSDAALANSAMVSTAKAVSTTSGALLASEQAGRKYLIAQNLGNRSIYVGASGVTTSTGIRLSSGSSIELRIGAAQSLHAVTDSGTQDTRILEVA